MNYRHIYHAGNHADVLKHVILTLFISSLMKKEKPFLYLETHAGRGIYDIQNTAAQKTKEYESGISKILSATNYPDKLKQYIDGIKAINQNNTLHFYPGSPLFVYDMLKQAGRSQDRLLLCEKESGEYEVLRRFFSKIKHVAIHQQDGYLSLKAHLPPKEQRGFILIDSPYENKDELTILFSSLQEGLKRWEKGTFAIWYPIKSKKETTQFYRDLQKVTNVPILIAELACFDEIPNTLCGSGMAITNPFWQIDEDISAVLPWLWQTLSYAKQGWYHLAWMNATHPPPNPAKIKVRG